MTTQNVDIVVRDRVARTIRTALEGIATSATRANVSINNVRASLRVAADGSVRLTGVSAGYNAVAAGANRATAATTRYNASLARQRGIFASTIRSARNLVALYAGIAASRGIIGAADQAKQLENRIKSVTKVQGDADLTGRRLAETQRRLFAIANEGRVGVLGVATAYQRFDKALSRVGASQEEVLDFPSTVVKALKIAGSTAQETESVMIQLGQALTKGNLDGEELRALRENAPIEVMEALARALGVTTGELKELGRQGRITTSVIRTAFRNLRDGVAGDFADLTPTVAEAFTVFGNKFTEFIANSETAQAVIRGVSNSILFLANNLPAVANAVTGFVAAWAALRGIPLVLAGIGSAAGLIRTGFLGARTAVVSFGGAMAALRAGTLGVIGLFNKLGPLAIAAFVGMSVAYRNEIKFMGEETEFTLGDVMAVEWRRLGDTVEGVTGGMKGNLDKVFSPSSFSEFFNGFTGLIKSMFAALIRFGAFIRTGFQEIFSGLWLGIRTGWLSFINFLDSSFAKMIDGLLKLINEKLIEPFNQIRTIVNAISGTNFSGLTPLPEGVAELGVQQRIREREQLILKLVEEDKVRNQLLQKSYLSQEQAEAELDQILRDLGFRQENYEAHARQRIETERQAAEELKRQQESLREAAEGQQQQQTAQAQAGAQARLQTYLAELAGIQQIAQQNISTHTNTQRSLSEVIRAGVIERDRINLIGNQALRQRELETSQALKESWNATANYIIEQIARFANAAIQALNQVLQKAREVISAMAGAVNSLPGGSAVTGAIGRTANSLGAIGSAIGGLAGSRDNVLGGSIGALTDLAAPFAPAIRDAVISGVQQGMESTATQQILAEGGQPFVENLRNEIGNIQNNPGLGSSEIANQVNRAFNSSAADVTQTMRDNLFDMDSVLPSVADGMKSLGNSTEKVGEYNDGVKAATNSQRKFNTTAKNGFDRLGRSVNQFGQQGGQVLKSIFGGAQEALLEFVRTGEFDFKKFIRGIAEDLLRLFTNQIFGKFLTGILGGFGGIGGSLFGGGFGGFGGFGFMDGGYTGTGARNKVAGVVHGQEYVMPARQTAQYRPILEAMRDGVGFGTTTQRSHNGNQSSPAISIHNYGTNADVQVQPQSDGSMRIEMRKIALETVRSEAPRQFSNNLRNANSRESKALRNNTSTKRRR